MADSSPPARLRHSGIARVAAGLLCVAAAAGLGGAPLAVADPPREFPTDERGFVDTPAHCQGSAVAAAYGRTESSLVAVCSGSGGQFQFRGVRLSDDAALMLDAAPLTGGGFSAVNDGVTYTVSPAELTVSSGEDTLIRQAMIEYHEPQS